MNFQGGFLFLNMCFHIKVSKESLLHKSKRTLFTEEKASITSELLAKINLPLYHSSGFQHPKLLVYTNNFSFPIIAKWGLVPNWINSEIQKKEIWNKTLNARSETVFEKPSFKNAITTKRCVVYLDGFYEFHHFKGKSYPYYIYRTDNKPLAIAGIYDTWVNYDSNHKEHTFSILTTKGNDFMAKIHNNPKLNEPRIPLILEENTEEYWLYNINTYKDLYPLQNIDNSILDCHTVRPLSGKNYIGNKKKISEKFHYPDLNPLTLF